MWTFPFAIDENDIGEATSRMTAERLESRRDDYKYAFRLEREQGLHQIKAYRDQLRRDTTATQDVTDEQYDGVAGHAQQSEASFPGAPALGQGLRQHHQQQYGYGYRPSSSEETGREDRTRTSSMGGTSGSIGLSDTENSYPFLWRSDTERSCPCYWRYGQYRRSFRSPPAREVACRHCLSQWSNSNCSRCGQPTAFCVCPRRHQLDALMSSSTALRTITFGLGLMCGILLAK